MFPGRGNLPEKQVSTYKNASAPDILFGHDILGIGPVWETKQPFGGQQMAVVFFTRNRKSEWGFACNQRADSRLFAGKGYGCPLASQLDSETVEAVEESLEQTRGDRCGRFWINLATRTVTMQVGASYENQVDQASF
jgi:hypothetical protein